MAIAIIAGHVVPVSDDGLLTNPLDWTPDIAEAMAQGAGITLTARHWKVIEFCRRDAAERGTAPGLRRITAGTGIQRAEMLRLFPPVPGRLAARISGLAMPRPARATRRRGT